MKIAFVYLPGRIARIDDSIKDGCVDDLCKYRKYHPSEFYYGAFELLEQGHDVGIFEVIERPRRSLKKYVAEKILYKKYLPVKTYAGIIDAVYFVLDKLEEYDVVVATTPGIAFSLGFWKMLRKFHKPIIGIQCGILNYSLNCGRVFFTRKLMNSMQTQLYGIGELDEIKKVYHVHSGKIEVNAFGVDAGFWHAGTQEADDGYILAVGNDALRDFNTLIRAAEDINSEVVIITSRPLPENLPANVKVVRGSWSSREIDDECLRDIYRKALAVAVPLHPGFQPSGQSVALQAMACSKPVILTKTKGLWDNEHLVERKNVLFVEPGDERQWVKLINELNSDKELVKRIGMAGREYVEKHGLIEMFAERIDSLCRKEAGVAL